MRLFFQTFLQTGAAHAPVKYFREERLLFPIRLAAGARKGELAWTPLGLGRAVHLLHNPWYAGAYAFGRHRWRTQPDGGTRRERVPREQWHALLRDAHPGYISWEEHERIEHQLHAGTKAPGWERRQGPPCSRAASSVDCAAAGCRSATAPGPGGQLVPDYVCPGRGRGYAEPLCQSTLGTDIDPAVGQLLVEAVMPMALDLALAVQHEIQARLDEADRLRHRQVERAQYDADRARHRYMQVDPANRLVADSLEVDWNGRLRALAVDFPTVWRDPTTPQQERKRMLALLIEDVTLLKQRQVTAHVRFRGGATTTLTPPRPLTNWELRATSAQAPQQMNTLLDEYTDAQVAAILNERGLWTGAGEAFDAVSVQWIRTSAGLTSLKARLLAAGMLTGSQIAAQLGVRRTTIGRWQREGRLDARICNEMGRWRYAPGQQRPSDHSSPRETAALGAQDISRAGGAV